MDFERDIDFVAGTADCLAASLQIRKKKYKNKINEMALEKVFDNYAVFV
jgi:hypothetical protein